MPPDPDDMLARQARTDSAAFAELYRRHMDHVFRFLMMRTGSVDDAQDLTALTFIAALEHIDQYQPQGRFRMWLLAIARHKAADFFRKNKMMVPLETIESLPAPEPLPDEAVTQHLELDRVLEALRHLAPDRAEALILRVLGEYSAAETAEIMGKSESAVKMLVYRAWGDLKRHLTPVVLQEGDTT
jgi:RNA polymerase sigma-70 factor (ECF subfamily)